MTNKHPFLIGALWIGCVPAVEAFDFGFKAGVHWATIPEFKGPLGGLDSSTTSSITAGAFVIFPLAGVLALQPEVIFVQKGTQLDAANSELDLETTLELEYLEFPILARITMMQRGPTSFYAFAGPSFGYGLRARERIESQDRESERDLDTIERFEVSLVLGGGVRFRRFLAEGRYLQGLTSIDEERRTHFKNRGIAVLFGFQFY